jgi:hypothetical protein
LGTSSATSFFTKLLVLSLELDLLAGDGEPGLADVRAAHARLAGREVVPGLQCDGEVRGRARGDVLLLGGDAQPVAAEQVELGGLVAVVGDAEGDVAAFDGRGRYQAVVRGRADGQRVAAALSAGRVRARAVGVLNATREQQRTGGREAGRYEQFLLQCVSFV